MFVYKVKANETLGMLALKFHTTIKTLMEDNPIIPPNQKIKKGWKLTIFTPYENAARDAEEGYEKVEEANRVKQELKTSDHLLPPPRDPIYYKDRLVLEGQIAFIKILKETHLIEIEANGFKNKIRLLSAGEILGVYKKANLNGSFYLVNGYRWVTAHPSYVSYEEIPEYYMHGKITLPPHQMNESVFSIQADNGGTAKPLSSIGYGPKQTVEQFKVAPQSFIGSGKAKTYKEANDGLASMHLLERPNFKRPVLKMVNGADKTKTIELRVLGFSANYSNSVNQSATNAGWMINVGAHNLPVLRISGFLMETKANDEVMSFMDSYRTYLAAKKTGDFYSLGVSTLFYKQTEYRGVIVSFSYSDREEETLHRKYNMEMLVLKEKHLTSSEIKAIPEVVNRKGLGEKSFRSDISAMLANPITGVYHTDFY